MAFDKKTIIILICALVGVILFSLAPNLIKLMVTNGGKFGLKNPGAVSFCNVLFVGNLCAAIVTGAVFGIGKIFKELWTISWKTKGFLLLASCLSVLYPAFLFISLEYTTVVNIVIISRFSGIIYLALAFFIYKTRIHWQETAGYVVIAASVVVMLLINNHGFHLSKGDLLVIIATIFNACVEIVSGKVLPGCSDKTYVFCRNFVSALIFFIIVLVFFKPGHFAEAFKGELWVLMFVYAAVAIVMAQLFWLYALKRLPKPTLGNAKLFDPIFTLTFAYFLLSEIPSASQFVIIGIIIVSVVVPKWLLRRSNKTSVISADLMDSGLAGK